MRSKKQTVRRRERVCSRGAKVVLSTLLAFALVGQVPLDAGAALAVDTPARAATALDTAVANDEQALALMEQVEADGFAAVGKTEVRVFAAGAALDRAGWYELEGDIALTEQVKVSVPKGETAVLDLKGHTLTVACDSREAFDTQQLEGTLVLVDSAFDKKDNKSAPGTIAFEYMGEATQGVHVLALEKRTHVESAANKETTVGEEAAVVVGNINLSIAGKSVDAKHTAGLRLERGHAYLFGQVSCMLEQHDGTQAEQCLASVGKEDLVSILEGTDAAQSLLVDMDELKVGAVLAHAYGRGKLSQADLPQLGLVSSDLSCKLVSDLTYVVEKQEEATSSDSSVNASEDGESPASSSKRSRSALAKVNSAGNVANLGSDLHALWTAQGTNSEYTIAKAGSYYLSNDLSASAMLSVNAPGQKVTLNLNDHVFSSSNPSGVAITITAASEVDIVGSDKAKSKIALSAVKTKSVIASSASKLVVRNATVEGVANDEGLYLRDLSVSAVRIVEGSLQATSSDFKIDMSNQANSDSSGNAVVKGSPSGICFESKAGDSSVSNCSITAFNSNLVPLREDSDAGYAYGIKSESAETVKVAGCSVRAMSALGSAQGLHGQGIVLEGETSSFNLESSDRSAVAFASAKGGVTLNAPIEASFTGGAEADHLLCQSEVEDAFVFGGKFSSKSSGVLVGQDDLSTNDNGTVVGSFSKGMDGSEQRAIAAMLSNALGSKGSCSLMITNDKVKFVLDAGKAVAQVVKKDGKTTACATVKSAVAAAEDGDVIEVLQDGLHIVFSKEKAEGKKFTIDLMGHAIASLSYSGDADLTVRSSKEGAGITGMVQKRNASVFSKGTGKLTLENIALTAVSSTSGAYGIYSSSTGAIVLDNVAIQVSAARSAAYGIRTTSAKAGALNVKGGSIAVRALSASVGAYGVSSSSKAEEVSISHCKMVVEGTDAVVHGVDVAGPLKLCGDGADSDILTVRSSDEGSNVCGVYMGGAKGKPRVELDSCAIATSGAAAGSGWCLSTGSGVADPTWVLTGEVKLASSTNNEVEQQAAPIVFDKGFSTAAVMHVSTLDGSVSEFAQLADGVDLEKLAAVIAGSPSGTQFGYKVKTVSSEQGTMLSWDAGSEVLNKRTGARYSSLVQAVAQASAGDVLSLEADQAVNGVLDLDKSLTIDLNGRMLSVSAGAKAAAGTSNADAAVRVRGKSKVIVADSAGGGVANIVVGAPVEKNRMTYQGFAVSEESSLTFDKAKVCVLYGGAEDASVVLALRGAAVVSGVLAARNGASLEVIASRQDRGFGVSDVKGVWVKGEATSVDFASDSSLTVRNNAAAVVQGSSDYPDYTGSTNAQSSSTVDMIELKCDKNGSLYKEICKKFLEHAVCDTAHETDRTFNTNIYYVTNMALESGMKVWAYSEPVKSSEIGKLSSIVPSRIFVRSPYATALDAYGVFCEGVDSDKIRVAAHISAATTSGRSYALFGCKEAAQWGAEESRLSVSSGKESYLAVASNKFDLNDYFELDKTLEKQQVTYPKNASMRAVALTAPVAQKIAEALPAAGSTREGIGEDKLESMLYPAQAQKVLVRFSNLHDTSGSPVAAKTVEVGYGKTISTAGDVKGLAKDYQVDGVAYRFVGWRMAGLSAGAAYEEAYVLDDLVLNSSVTGVIGSEVILVAQYVPVREGEHLVTFSSDHVLAAYPVAEGAVPSYLACWNSGGIAAPQKSTTASDYETGYNYVFAGWREGKEGAKSSSILSPVTGDCLYAADYSKVLTKSSIVFRYRAKAKDGSSALTDGRIISFDWNSLASAEIEKKVGDNKVINDHGTIYTLLGWSPRKTDVEPLYTGDFWLKGSEKGYSGDSNKFFAVYEQAEQTVDVRFFSDKTELGHVDGVPANRTLSAVLSDAGIATDKLKAPSASQQYRGWGTSADSKEIVEMSISTAFDVVGEKSSLDLYVLWKTKVFTVSFYDSDKSKIGTVGVEYGATVMKSNPKFKVKGLPSNFKEWTLKSGKRFSLDSTKVYKDVAVYASYRADASAPAGGKKKVSSLKAPTLSNPGGLDPAGGISPAGLDDPSDANDELEQPDAQDTEDAEGAADVQNDASAVAIEGSGLPGIIALAAACLLLLAAVGLTVLWFVRRRAKDEDEEFFQLTASERVQF